MPPPVRENIHAASLAAPGAYSVIGEDLSGRLHASPTTFTLKIIKRHIRDHRNHPQSGSG